MLPIWCKDNEGKWVRIPYEILDDFKDGTWGFTIYTQNAPAREKLNEFYYRCRGNFMIDSLAYKAVLITTEETIELKLKEQELARGKPK